MASRAYYLLQAKCYFDMAAGSQDETMRARWIARANENLILADALGDDPVQQQQQGRSQGDNRND